MRRRWQVFSRRATGLIAGAAVVVAVGAVAAYFSDPAVLARRHPVAVVLVQTKRGSELATVDLEKMRVVRRTRLRSLCLSIAAVPGSRVVVTAQCGGPDRAADRAAGVYSADTGSLDYVDLRVQNPLDVAATEDFALLVHGLERDGRLVTSLVDMRGRHRVTHGTAAAGALQPEAQGEDILVPEVAVSGEEPERRSAARITAVSAAGRRKRYHAFTARWCRVISGAERKAGPIHVLARGAAAGSDGAHREEWRLLSLSSVGAPHRGSSPLSPRLDRPIPVPTLEHGCADACLWGSRLVVADADGIDMSDPGDRVRVFDSRTGRQTMVLPIPHGMPAALEVWNGRLLVVDGVSGDLFAFDAEGRRMARIALGGVPVGTADVAVLR